MEDERCLELVPGGKAKANQIGKFGMMELVAEALALGMRIRESEIHACHYWSAKKIRDEVSSQLPKFFDQL